ncbi:MAG: sigma-54-dependent Fis family transcriptional regulator, partial [Candidatus Zixiibacteriota bacterium]
RILAATNKELRQLVAKGSFREDLYFRLGVLTIDVPPVSERENDILLLCQHNVTKFARESGKVPPRFTDRALNILKNYSWPGNVREIENLMQRLIVMTDNDLIDAPDLPSFMRFSASKKAGLNRTLAQVEYEHIKNVLTSVGGNKTRAAEILGIDRKTLREKLKHNRK